MASPKDAAYVDPKRMKPLSPLQERMMQYLPMDARGRLGGLYGPYDFALDVATPYLPIPAVGTFINRLDSIPFLKKLFGGFQKADDFLPMQRMGEFDVYPPKRYDISAEELESIKKGLAEKIASEKAYLKKNDLR